MADDIVGETDAMTNLALEVSFDQEKPKYSGNNDY